jgi:hypothetical protein
VVDLRHGFGMTTEQQAKLFEEFNQAEMPRRILLARPSSPARKGSQYVSPTV